MICEPLGNKTMMSHTEGGEALPGATLETGRVLGPEAPVVDGVHVVGLTLVVADVHQGGRVDFHFALQLVAADLPLMYLPITDTGEQRGRKGDG